MSKKIKKKKAPRRRRAYHGQAALYCRNGHWWALWTENGKSRSKTLKTTDILVAEKRIAQFRIDQKAGKSSSLKPPTVHEAIDQWLKWSASQVSSGTLADYRYYANKMKKHLKTSMPVTDVTAQDIEAYVLNLKKEGLAPYTVKTHLNKVHTVFSRLVKQRVIPFNPTDDVNCHAPLVRRKPWPDALYDQYLIDLLAERDATNNGQSKLIYQDLHDRAIIIWWSGLRTIEVDRLLWADIDFDAEHGPQWIIDSPEKKGGCKTLPIHPVIQPLLKERKKRGLEGPSRGRHTAMKRGWRTFNLKYPKYAQYDHHCMRHSFVTRMSKLYGRETACLLARHSTVEMNQHYDHRGIDDMRLAFTQEFESMNV
jgi:integrase